MIHQDCNGCVHEHRICSTCLHCFRYSTDAIPRPDYKSSDQNLYLINWRSVEGQVIRKLISKIDRLTDGKSDGIWMEIAKQFYVDPEGGLLHDGK